MPWGYEACRAACLAVWPQDDDDDEEEDDEEEDDEDEVDTSKSKKAMPQHRLGQDSAPGKETECKQQ